MESLQPLLFMALSKGGASNLFTTVLLLCLAHLLKAIPFHLLADWMHVFFTQRRGYVYMNIPSHEVPVLRGWSQQPAMKLVYSKTFLAVIHYVNSDPVLGFDSLTEIMTRNTELATSNNNDKEAVEYVLMPIDNQRKMISRKHGGGIYFELQQVTEEQGDESSSKTPKSNNKRKHFTLVLSTNHGTIQDIRAFVEDCVAEHDRYISRQKDDHCQWIFDYKGFEKENDQMQLKFHEHRMEHFKDLTTNVFFEGKDKLLRYIEPFVSNNNLGPNPGEEKYRRSGFTFKAGLLFSGQPGCGKTSTIKAILKYTHRHAIVVPLSKIKTCEELEMIFRNRTFQNRELSGKQLCFVLEDCDAFEDNNICKARREIEKDTTNNNNNVDPLLSHEEANAAGVLMKKMLLKEEDAVNLACFLNLLDGIIELYGVMIIMTTNHPEKIDPALIRPGRFDFKHEFRKASKQVLLEMLRFKYQQVDDVGNIDVDDYEDEALSPAEIQSVCFRHDRVEDALNELKSLYRIKNL